MSSPCPAIPTILREQAALPSNLGQSVPPPPFSWEVPLPHILPTNPSLAPTLTYPTQAFIVLFRAPASIYCQFLSPCKSVAIPMPTRTARHASLAFPSLLKFPMKIFQSLSKFSMTLFPSLLEFAMTIFPSLLKFPMTIFPSLLKLEMTIIPSLSKFPMTTFPSLLNIAMTIFPSPPGGRLFHIYCIWQCRPVWNQMRDAPLILPFPQ